MNTMNAASPQAASTAFTGRIEKLFPRVGTAILRYGLVIMLLLGGLSKWTKGEADAIQPWMAHSPFTFWLYSFLSGQGASIVIGVVELCLAALIVTRQFLPKISAWGSLLAIPMFVITLSFLITTPKLDGASQGFLIKDIFLLGAAIVTAAEAFIAARKRRP